MSKIQSTSVAGKETIYVDIDDEITSIIDKVRGSSSKVVALVLPKRATVLQSVVNMKLLKRTADTAQKNLVLVTSEAGLMPLAGSVGLHVASTPTSKPTIPPAPIGPSDEPEDIDEPLDIVDGNSGEAADFDPASAASVPVGELAAAGTASKIAASSVDEDLELPDETEPAAPAAAVKPKKNKKLAVPNFDTFRKKLLLGLGVLALLIVAWIFAFVVLPRAAVTIHTNTSTITSSLNLTLDAAAKALDPASKTVPATAASEQKSSTQQVTATGQQNNGTKATGNITITNCGGSDVTLPAGTSFSANSHTFIAQTSVLVPDSNFTSPITGSKCKNDGKATVGVTALKGGTDYNLAAASYSVSNNPGGLTAEGSQMAGGTDNITKIVAQSDIDSATSKIKAQDTASVKQQLTTDLQTKGLQVVATTFLAGDPQVTTSAKAGDAADSVTVTAATTYTMLGVKKSDLKALVDANVTSQLDKGKQVILDDGVANAKFSQQNPATTTTASVAMHTDSVAGPQIDTAQLKKQIIGKKSGDIKNLVKQTPGVTNVDVKYSPFWVTVTPKSASKVTVQIDKSTSSHK